jgi:aspartate-semialdehyde dehydrogenase
MQVAVVGATGAVGLELVGLLAESDVSIARITPIASDRSVGRVLPSAGDTLVDPVVTLDDVDFAQHDVAFFSAGAVVSRQVAEKAAGAGCLVIDNSSAFRMCQDVPLVVPQVNPQELARRPASGIIANPNCSTSQLVRALAPLHEMTALRRVIVATYQAASGGGLRGLSELASDSRTLLSRPDTPLAAGKFGRPLAFDLIPQIGNLDEFGVSHEESKIRYETRRILGQPNLPVSATAVRAGVFHCHSEAVHIEFDRPVTASEAEDALTAAPGIRLYRSAEQLPYPSPRSVEFSGERREVHVGRVRADMDDPHALWLWIVADNLWVGAALNAIQILETAVSAGWWNNR